MARPPDMRSSQCVRLPVAPQRWGTRPCSHRALASLIVALAAAIIASGMLLGCSRSEQQRSSDPPPAPTASITGAETEETPVARDYQFVSERNVFRPLVVAPKSEGGGSGEVTPSTPNPRSTSAAGPSRPNPPRPPDPTADLAITGITETTDGLRVLIEKLSTREGKYAAVGDVAFGLTVKTIGRGTVTLAQGEKEYELKLGQKEIGPTTPATPQTGEKPGTQTASATPSTSSSSGAPPFGGRMDWRNMSPEERQRAMEERRRWWEGLSESERGSYRSGFSRGSGRGPGRGSGRGPGR